MAPRARGLGVWLAAGAIWLTGCPQPPPAAEKPPPPEVTVSKPVAREVTEYFEFPGRTAAVGEVEVRARVTGYLVKVNFEDGQDVQQGDLLFEIDPRPYQAALDRARGELTRLQALLDKAKADVARSERLRQSGAASEDEYEQHVAQAAIHQASIQSALAAVREAELDLEFTQIKSPIDGRVSRRQITEGNLVQPGSDEASVLTTVVTTDPIYVYFPVDEHALLKYEALAWGSGRELRPDRIKTLQIPVEIALGGEDGFPHTGILDFVDNRVERGTGTIWARGIFANPKRYLTPGLFVRVRLPFGQPHPALLISERAIGTDQKEKFLWTVNKDNVVEYRQVKVGPLREGLRVIEAGLTAEDWVVVKGLQRVRAGATVQPQRAETNLTAAPQPAEAEVVKQDPAVAGRAVTN